MKSLLAATSLLLASAAIPSVALAQEEMAVTENIVVTAKFQRDWDKGSGMVTNGLRQMEKAKTRLISASADVVNAQNKRESALAQADNAAAIFRNITTNMPYFADAQEAKLWSQQVTKSATEWARFDAQRDAGASAFDKASKSQAQAQAAVDKAQARIDQGRAMMANAEQLSALASSN